MPSLKLFLVLFTMASTVGKLGKQCAIWIEWFISFGCMEGHAARSHWEMFTVFAPVVFQSYWERVKTLCIRDGIASWLLSSENLVLVALSSVLHPTFSASSQGYVLVSVLNVFCRWTQIHMALTYFQPCLLLLCHVWELMESRET